MADNLMYSFGMLMGWMMIKVVKRNKTNQGGFIGPLVRAVKEGCDCPAFNKGMISMTVTLRTSPTDNTPLDAQTTVSEATKLRFGAAFRPHFYAFVRFKPDATTNTTAAHIKWGQVNQKGFNTMGSSERFQHHVSFQYAGDVTSKTDPADYLPMAHYVIDADTLDCMKLAYSDCTNEELAQDHEIIAGYFGRSRVHEIAKILDPSLVFHASHHTNAAYTAGKSWQSKRKFSAWQEQPSS
jgi:hypothetical protein